MPLNLGKLSVAAMLTILFALPFASSSFADTVKYTYDNVDRLEQVEYPDGSTIKYSYDNVGNRLKERRFNLSLTPSLPSPQQTGTSVDFTAGMSPPGSYEYRFWLRSVTGSWSVVQTYSTSPIWTWPSGVADYYFIQVDVRDAGSSAIRDAAKVIVYNRGNIPSAVDLSPDLASPQPPGVSVDFTATPTPAGTYEYRFWLRSATGSWSVVQPFSTATTWTWPSGNPDNYFVQVDARAVGSSVERDQADSIAFNRWEIPTDVSLAPSVPSPQPAGTQVDFTATPTPAGTYEYRFWMRSATGSWSVVQPYSTNNVWSWNPSGAADNYFIQVDIRQIGANVNYNDAAVISYQLN